METERRLWTLPTRKRLLAKTNMWILPLLLYCGWLIEPTQCNGISIIGPKVIHPNRPFTVAITNSNPTKDAKLELTLTEEDPAEIFKSNRTNVVVRRKSSRSVVFQVGSIPKGAYSLHVKHSAGSLPFERTISLRYVSKTMSIFVQTDKPVYKPGDMLRFRVVIMDIDTRPVFRVKSLVIDLLDEKNDKIRQWNGTKLYNGVYESAVVLPGAPVLGKWALNVTAYDGLILHHKEHHFTVKEYVLPKFIINARASELLLIENKKIALKVQSFYTFGGMVKGEVNVDLYLTDDRRRPDQTTRTTIDGSQQIQFDLEDEIELEEDDAIVATVMINVTVTEAFTDRTVHRAFTLDVFKNPYEITMQKPTTAFHTGQAYPVKFTVLDHDGQVPCCHKLITTIRYVDHDEVQMETDLDEFGVATVFLRPPEDVTEIEIEAKHGRVNFVALEPITLANLEEATISVALEAEAKLKIDKPVNFIVQSTTAMTYFSYVVFSKGKIVAQGYIPLQNKKKFRFKVNLTAQMAPKSVIFVFTSGSKGPTYYNYYEINFNAFENKVKFFTDASQYLPGQDIEIFTDTAPDSYVAFYAIDVSALHVDHERNSLGFGFTKQDVIDELDTYVTTDESVNSIGRFGLFLESTADVNHGQSRLSRFCNMCTKDSKKAIHLRTEFHEVFLWHNISMDGAESHKALRSVPDTITSWQLNAFALSPTLGFGMMDKPVEFVVKKPFYIVASLPYSIKRNEISLIQVTVFSFLGSELSTDVWLYNKKDEIEFIDNASNDTTRRMKTITVPASYGKPTSFLIKAKKLGHIAIKIEATNALASDGLEHMLLVTPESRRYEFNEARFIEHGSFASSNHTIPLSIPESVDEGSVNITFAVDPIILGSVIENIDKVFDKPAGSGEQMMLNTIINAAVLDYLEEAGLDNKEVKTKAINYLQNGYVSQLNYKVNDGSFSTYSHYTTSTEYYYESVWRDSYYFYHGNYHNHGYYTQVQRSRTKYNYYKKGCTFLTAFVAKSFKISSKYITVDTKVIEAAFNWLASKQDSNGLFPEVGDVYNTAMQGGLMQKKLALSAYVAIAFIENSDIRWKHSAVVNKTVQYLSSKVDEMDTYELALTAYMLAIYNHPRKNEVLSKLEGLSIKQNDTRFWNYSTLSDETTSYALLTLLAHGKRIEALPVMKWLAQQREKTGVFYGSQSSFVGLTALAKMSAFMGHRKNNYRIKVHQKNRSSRQGLSVDTSRKNVFDITEHTTQVLHKRLPADGRVFDVEVAGLGYGLFQLTYMYHHNVEVATPTFNVTAEVLPESTNYVQQLRVCVKYQPKEVTNQTSSNMVYVEVFFPSGFDVDAKSLRDLWSEEEGGKIKNFERRFVDTSLVVYYNSMDNRPRCFEITAHRVHMIARQLPAYVIAYDSDVKDHFGIQQYEGKILQPCDICEGDDCLTLNC